MKYLLGLMLLVTAAVASVTSRHCSNLLPGLNRLFRGIDVTTLDLLPLEFSGSHGYKQPVIDPTCTQLKKWTLNGVEYDQPDEVTLISSFPGGWLSSQVDIFKSYHEVKRSMSSSAGMDYGLGIFSASSSYKKMQHSITNNSDYIERVSAFSSGRRADLAPFWALQLGSIPQVFVDRFLTENFESSPAAYNQFIQYYGTHFLKNARYGGVISLVIETNSSYFFGREDREIEAQARGSFLNLLKAEGGYSGSTTKIDNTFEQLSRKYVRYYGGNTNLLSSSGISVWQPTVTTNPWLFSGDLVPVTELIRNETKKQSLERAIVNYLNKAMLKEYVRLLEAAAVKFPQFPAVQEVLNYVRNLSDQVIPSQSHVDNVSEMADRIGSVPDWFIREVNLCYQSVAALFSGGIRRIFGTCSPLGSRTSWYNRTSPLGPTRKKRFLEGIVKGLLKRKQKMLLKITAPTRPTKTWFRDVEICMKRECDEASGVGDEERCEKVNSEGVEFLYKSGCSYSWKIKVPSGAPEWTRPVQLCHYGRDSESQPPRSFCAGPNQWTPAYNDGSARYVSWGLNLDLVYV